MLFILYFSNLYSFCSFKFLELLHLNVHGHFPPYQYLYIVTLFFQFIIFGGENPTKISMLKRPMNGIFFPTLNINFPPTPFAVVYEIMNSISSMGTHCILHLKGTVTCKILWDPKIHFMLYVFCIHRLIHSMIHVPNFFFVIRNFHHHAFLKLRSYYAI